MGYTRETYERANAILAERRAKAERDADRRREEIYTALPEVREIDRKLAMTGAKILSVIGLDKETVAARMAEIERENEELQQRRDKVLASAGYPADYTEPRYTCEKCRDKGFIGSQECICRKRELVRAGYEHSGIGKLLETQTFDSFDLAKCGEPQRAAYRSLRRFAESFCGNGDDNYILTGGTGLGKTHLSSAVAGVVIERGFDVKYDTARKIISAFDDWQFHRSRDDDDDPTARYFDCDLLIIDDLGTEVTTSYTTSWLYELINDRINAGRSTIINTNLTGKEIRRRYDVRIASRLFGEYKALVFAGDDMRWSRLKRGVT